MNKKEKNIYCPFASITKNNSQKNKIKPNHEVSAASTSLQQTNDFICHAFDRKFISNRVILKFKKKKKKLVLILKPINITLLFFFFRDNP